MRMRFGRTRGARRAGVVIPGLLALVAIVDPVTGREEGGRRRRRDDADEHPRYGRGVAHLEVGEALLVEVERVEEGRIRRPARALAAAEEIGRAKVGTPINS